MSNYVEIPTFIKQPNYDNYNEEFNQTIRELLGSDFWIMPNIPDSLALNNAASVNTPVGAFWYNSDKKKMQLKTDIGVVETVTSAP